MTTLLLYGAGKIVAYTVVCYVGLTFFRVPGASSVLGALGLGMLRFLIGLSFALPIFLFSDSVHGSLADIPLRGLLTYLAVYVPVRWLEWSFMALMVVESSRTLPAFLLGSTLADRTWRVAGIATSCVADIPMIASLGWQLPVGRFFC